MARVTWLAWRDLKEGNVSWAGHQAAQARTRAPFRLPARSSGLLAVKVLFLDAADGFVVRQCFT